MSTITARGLMGRCSVLAYFFGSAWASTSCATNSATFCSAALCAFQCHVHGIAALRRALALSDQLGA